MSNDSEFLNTPIKLSLGDLELELTRLSDYNVTEIDDWIKARFIRSVIDATAGLPMEERRVFVADAQREAQSLSWLTSEGNQMLQSPDGLAKLLSIASGGAMGWEELRLKMIAVGNLDDLKRQLQQIMPRVPAAKGGESNTGKKSKSRKTKKKKSTRP